MAQPSDSFKQFNYFLRPSKQVERKLMIEVLSRLSDAGYKISDYKYIGFGSPFYVDFIMFHKYLFMDDMVCVEWGDIPSRMKFNKPYHFIRLRLGAFLKHIPTIKSGQRHLVWLDYDRSLDEEMLRDVDGALSRLGPKSVFIITIDARARLPKELLDLDRMSLDEREERTVQIYADWFRPYTGQAVTRSLIAQAHVGELFREVVTERIRQSLVGSGSDVQFVQLFNFLYRDGAPMITVGGMIGTSKDKSALEEAGILGHRWVRTGPEFLEISVPPLTTREKYWLDSNLIGRQRPKKLQFELDDEHLENYLLFYKEYPTYLEALL
jgi:hypothetical protein